MSITMEMRQNLIDSAVRVVAREGLDRTTTKLIAAEAGLNEAYIYRGFSSKEDLLRAALHMEDTRFVEYITKHLSMMRLTGISWKERCYLLFKYVWEFILEVPDDCRFYIRYYYSANFLKYARDEHLECYRRLKMIASIAFKPDISISLLLHQMFETLLGYAARVNYGEMQNDEQSCRTAFEQIYYFTAPHFKESVLTEEEKGVS